VFSEHCSISILFISLCCLSPFIVNQALHVHEIKNVHFGTKSAVELFVCAA
jgi:hypothetical protein